jgi:predicted membrane protein
MTTLKQFLKPDWRKIVLFVVLIIILPIFPQNLCQDTVCLIPIPFSIILAAFINTSIKNGINYFTDPFGNFIIIIIVFIIEFLLSCLIVWIYDKFRKKK